MVEFEYEDQIDIARDRMHCYRNPERQKLLRVMILKFQSGIEFEKSAQFYSLWKLIFHCQRKDYNRRYKENLRVNYLQINVKKYDCFDDKLRITERSFFCILKVLATHVK